MLIQITATSYSPSWLKLLLNNFFGIAPSPSFIIVIRTTYRFIFCVVEFCLPEPSKFSNYYSLHKYYH